MNVCVSVSAGICECWYVCVGYMCVGYVFRGVLFVAVCVYVGMCVAMFMCLYVFLLVCVFVGCECGGVWVCADCVLGVC